MRCCSFFKADAFRRVRLNKDVCCAGFGLSAAVKAVHSDWRVTTVGASRFIVA